MDCTSGNQRHDSGSIDEGGRGQWVQSARLYGRDECAKVSDERVISVGTAGFSTSIVKLNATISTNKPVQQRAIQFFYFFFI